MRHGSRDRVALIGLNGHRRGKIPRGAAPPPAKESRPNWNGIIATYGCVVGRYRKKKREKSGVTPVSSGCEKNACDRGEGPRPAQRKDDVPQAERDAVAWPEPEMAPPDQVLS